MPYELTLPLLTEPKMEKLLPAILDSLPSDSPGANFGRAAGTALAATAAEINRAADVSTRIVTHVASATLTPASHEGKTNLLGEVGGNALVTLKLPPATGSGAIYKFIVSVLNTSTYVITHSDTGTDVFSGSIKTHDNDSTAATAYAASGTDNTLTLNGGTTGGAVGDWVVFEDILAGVWAVYGLTVVPAGSNIADPFSTV